MRSSGRSFLKNSMSQHAKNVQETRDAILWNVVSKTQVQLKIQGSDQLVIANYPQNTSSKPAWMKVGSAVRILHRGGARGHIEIVGPGSAIPTNNANVPPIAHPPDTVIRGCNVIQIPTGPQMAVMVLEGQIRISGQTIATQRISMTDTVYNMSMGGYMGTIAAVFFVPGVPQGQFRQDIVVVNNRGVVQYVEGTPFTNTEVIPVTPAGCLLLNNILATGGQTAIKQADIGAHYQTPYLASLQVSFETISGIYYGAWSYGSGYVVDFSAWDQYGNAFIGIWTESLTVITGTATVQQISKGRWFIGASSASQFASLNYSVSGTNISAKVTVAIPK